MPLADSKRYYGDPFAASFPSGWANSVSRTGSKLEPVQRQVPVVSSEGSGRQCATTAAQREQWNKREFDQLSDTAYNQSNGFNQNVDRFLSQIATACLRVR